MRPNFDNNQFQVDLLTWYHREKRDLPWRRTSNPYYIWVSEIMLQQTRVDTVIPYYEKFIATYPTMEALANAEEEELLKIWEGLGYYSRVRNLQAGVQEVIRTFKGEVPRTRKEISSLKGIGPYTAGAILSIAFGLPEHAVDGNVMRVYARMLEIDADISQAKSKKIFEEGVMETISHDDPSSFNQAIMELGATVCTPKKPTCLLCPVQQHCGSFEKGTQLNYPVKTKKIKVKQETIVPIAIQNEQGQFLMRKRPAKGLLSNMWEFPYLTTDDPAKTSMLQTFKKIYGFSLSNVQTLSPYKHVFSHLVWTIHPYYANVSLSEIQELKEEYRFVSREEIQELPTAVPVLAHLEQLDQQIKREQ